ncbi:MAG: diguanylate cyclase [Nitrospinota bacterium]|nr:diguanylate cyclase [Nitrospinota bacterium]
MTKLESAGKKLVVTSLVILMTGMFFLIMGTYENFEESYSNLIIPSAIILIALSFFLKHVFELLGLIRETESHLHLSASVFENSVESIIITDPRGRIVSVNPSFTEVTGYTEAEVLGKNPRILSSGKHEMDFYEKMWKAILDKGQWSGEIWNRRKDGLVFPEQLSITAIKDKGGKVTHYAGVFTDISEHKKHVELIEYMAFHDNLTGLINRLTFYDLLQVEIAHAKRYGYTTAVMFLDLDYFKEVNDNYGHNMGDLLLKKVAKDIRNCLRSGDTVARFGGDEFTALLPQLRKDEDFKLIASKIVDLFKKPFNVNGYDLRLGVSIGIAIYPTHGDDVTSIMNKADDAMYYVKNHGRNNYRLYDDTIPRKSGNKISV